MARNIRIRKSREVAGFVLPDDLGYTFQEMPSEDELGAKSALPRKGFVPVEEISNEHVLTVRFARLRG